MEIRRIMVVGAGLMGSGIAQVCAQAGFPVALRETQIALAERGRENIANQLRRQVEKGRMTAEQREEILARIMPTANLADGAEADLVIEAVTENVAVKQQVFREVDQIVQPGAILASNTSTISITLLGAATRRPQQVIGMHFFIPAPVMKLIEIIRGLETSDEVHETATAVARALGKTPVDAPDSPGFTVNRVFVPMWNEAMYMVLEGTAPEAVDTALKLGGNLPMGPLELADFAGLDTVLATMEVLHRELGEDKYRPCPLLRKLVAAGHYGRKSGRGFYDWSTGERRPLRR